MIKINQFKLSKKRTSAGFSLLEILVSVAILASVLTGIMLMLSYSIKSDSEAKMRTTAKDLIQEGTDIFRRERDRLGWSTVYDQLETLNHSSYCFNVVTGEPDNNIFDALPVGDSCSFNLDVDGASQPFKRVAVITLNLVQEEIEVEMIVSWENDRDADSPHAISSILLLKPW